MGLFGNRDQKLLKEVMKKSGTTAKSAMFECKKCGRRQRITYFGPNDSWTCPQCRTRNYCS